MNQGRIWTVVNPTVGLPLLLGSVTVIAILVHFAVLSNTAWFPKYWQGGTVAAAPAAPAPAAAPAAKK
ncbi:Antenna complex, alpha/beta subunit [Rhodopseudomonas palustris HaA2]|uniref:Antenna complex, alpha/beta subunit n=1 Tax=Rhodopseudomonas palustris (strain HaA2) TaxID=316058 RepID=Q2J0G6_RHOP2|nr:light-harvesting protein [Rhodopseudomonas palustris]ABD06044.1 Antenna complex, alpha/beta subunit [Rhodopseudomonas palustris HaA2]